MTGRGAQYYDAGPSSSQSPANLLQFQLQNPIAREVTQGREPRKGRIALLETFYEACCIRIKAFPCSGSGRLLQHVQVSARERQSLLTGRQRCCARNHGQLRKVQMSCAPNGIVVFDSRPASRRSRSYGTRMRCFCNVTNRK
jgi:hypothetical protein